MFYGNILNEHRNYDTCEKSINSLTKDIIASIQTCKDDSFKEKFQSLLAEVDNLAYGTLSKGSSLSIKELNKIISKLSSYRSKYTSLSSEYRRFTKDQDEKAKEKGNRSNGYYTFL